jgi:hypothetical protein
VTTEPISKVVNLTIMDMLMLEPECPLNLHIVDSDEMGLDLIPKIVATDKFLIGIQTAVIRHKIAFHHNFSIDRFSFIRENKSDLTKVIPTGTQLVLWDYLNLSQPLAQNIIYAGWDRVDLVVVLRNLFTPSGEQNISLHNLVLPTT